MLVITRSGGSDLTRTFKLVGKPLKPWIGKLESACGESHVTPDRFWLYLYDLTFMAAARARFLARLIHLARVIACSGFVAEMLHLNGR